MDGGAPSDCMRLVVLDGHVFDGPGCSLRSQGNGDSRFNLPIIMVYIFVEIFQLGLEADSLRCCIVRNDDL